MSRVRDTEEPRKACGLEAALLSGYLDGVLTQGDRQRVQLHLQQCPACRGEVEDLAVIREAARTTPFIALVDDQWDESPRGSLSRWARNFGWLVLVGWTVLAVVLVAARPAWPGRWAHDLMVMGSLVGWGSLLLSAAIDRGRTWRSDLYRGVKR